MNPHISPGSYAPAFLRVFLIILLCLSGPAVAQGGPNKPNVVFMLADNVGWGDLSVYGGTLPTPRIDSIAKDGLRFNNYTVEAQCTPTRAAIMTGRLPVRSHRWRT